VFVQVSFRAEDLRPRIAEGVTQPMAALGASETPRPLIGPYTGGMDIAIDVVCGRIGNRLPQRRFRRPDGLSQRRSV